MAEDKKVGRRGWLRAVLPAAAEAVAEALPGTLMHEPASQRRPPGALSEGNFLARCTGCGDCVEACPHGAIHVFKPDTGERAGTPVMLPDKRPCHMCEGFPCAQACEVRALVTPTEPVWHLGQVRVAVDRCLPYKGPECGACDGHCPTQVQAIQMVANKPQVDAEQCVGCGLCIQACPTFPPALELKPL